MAENQSSLQVSKDFSCSKEKLFNAWTQENELKQWWKPLGKQLSHVTNEMKEGGKIEYQVEDGSLKISGEYKSAQPQQRLEYTWKWHLESEPVEDTEYTLDVQFEGDESKCSISVSQQGFSNENSIEPHKQGWEQALQHLEDHLSNAGDGSSATGSTDQGNTSGSTDHENTAGSTDQGHNELEEQQKVAGG